METSERAEVVERLKESRTKLLAGLEGLSQKHWEFQPAEGRWSIHNCVEHVVLVEDRITKRIAKVLEDPPEPEKKAAAAAKEPFLRDGSVLKREQRFNAPEPVHPKKHWPEVSQLLHEFESTRARTIEFVETAEGELSSHFIAHPVFGELNCRQWLYLLSLHCERHLAQIEEIKADAAYPQQLSTHA